MAVRINPCFRCPISAGCEHRHELRRRISGIGARSVEFPCDRLAADLRPGRRIEINHPVWNEDGDPYGRAVGHMNVPATITSVATGYRFACTVDPIDEVMNTPNGEDANKYRFRRKMRHFRIVRFLDEPDLRICEAGNLIRDGVCDRKDAVPGEKCACQFMSEVA